MNVRTITILLFTALQAPALAFAQSTASKETAVTGGTLTVIAYFAFVGIMMGYLALLSFRQRRLDRDIEALEKRLDELAELQ